MNIVKFTVDSFQNFAARVGLGSGNQHDQSQYNFDFVSRDRLQLEAMYRSSWVVGQVVDVVAEDMTREGITLRGFENPEDIEAINQCLDRLEIWDKLCNTIKWGRLYGGCLAVMLIDGQRPETPLKLESISKGQFKGLMVLDRWMVLPSLQDLVTEYGPHYGKPKYYDVITDAVGFCNQRIHHSRVIRIDGVDLPYWQSIAENLWGQSVIERLIDRLTIFDSATLGAGQLVYKAHLRTYKVDKLREIIAKGGAVYEALLKQINQIRQFQSNEGMTLMDASDSFETHQYSFTGLDNILLQFGQQISGAVQIPLVRLFGQSPAGLNSTGESDLSNYYDNINQQQERRLRSLLHILIRVVSLSELGHDLPKSFKFDFASLWQMSDKEKAEVANTVTTAVINAVEQGIVSEQTALKELRQSSEVTGIWSSITDDDIEQANDEPPKPNIGADNEGESPYSE
jgi:phage-related protein (TIGR01555 family)